MHDANLVFQNMMDKVIFIITDITVIATIT